MLFHLSLSFFFSTGVSLLTFFSVQMIDKGQDITEIFHISMFLYFRLVLLIQYIYIYDMVTHPAMLSRTLVRLADHRAGWCYPVRWI